LVEWVITDCKFPINELKILDIGSGSGCIPVSLKRKLRKAEIWGCDISEESLQVSKKNAVTLGTAVKFLQLDFLDKEQWSLLPSFDVIISNPPYIPEKDATAMHPNVLQYEPSTALFVPDIDPLVFYKAIAEFGKTHLNIGGAIYLEIHEDLGEATKELLQTNGYTTEIKKDMQQKNRMIKSGLEL
jgi:release factor glutamine methyltransferase